MRRTSHCGSGSGHGHVPQLNSCSRSSVDYFSFLTTVQSLSTISECRCDERLKGKDEGFTCLTYTGLRGGLEHLKIETRLIDERFPSVMCECVIVTLKSVA